MPVAATRVLFACAMNSVRSPMAEGLARKFCGDRVGFESAGVQAQDIDGFALCVMAEIGVALMDHVPRRLDEVDLSPFDLIVTLSPEAHHRVLELTRDFETPVEYWPTEDVTHFEGARDHKLAAYRAMRDRLEKRIKRRFG